MAETLTTLRILVPEVHDGLGGIHRAGDIVALPKDVADVFLTRNLAALADSSDTKAAEAKAKQVEIERQHADMKSRAESAMRLHDALPADLRSVVNEHGNAALDAILKEAAEKEAAAAAPKRSMTLRVTDDPDPFGDLAKLEADARKKSRRK